MLLFVGCLAGLLFNWIGFDKTRKYAVICRGKDKCLDGLLCNWIGFHNIPVNDNVLS